MVLKEKMLEHMQNIYILYIHVCVYDIYQSNFKLQYISFFVFRSFTTCYSILYFTNLFIKILLYISGEITMDDKYTKVLSKQYTVILNIFTSVIVGIHIAKLMYAFFSENLWPVQIVRH